MKKISRIYIEVTNVCNLSCSFCIGNTRPPGFLNIQEFTYILEQIKPYTNHIYLHVLGEPLLHPQLNEILITAQSFEMNVNITTNGTLLAKTQPILLNSPALRKVSISLHSLEEGSQYSREDYLQNIVSFVNTATKKDIFCELRLWNLGVNDINNDSLFISLCRLLNLDTETQKAARAKISVIGNITLAPKLFLGKAARFVWPNMNEPRTEGPVFCHGLRKQMAILSDGTVVPCCLDSKGDISLGNIFKTPLVQILSNDRSQALYQGFSRRQPSEELCRRCGYAKRF